MVDFEKRLSEFLARHDAHPEFLQLSQDASTREYFRISWEGRPAVACIYPEAFAAEEQNYLDVTGLFLAGGLPVAEIYAVDEELGIIVLEDLGDDILRDRLAESTHEERERLLEKAIALIAKIQAATPLAYRLDSIAAKLRFDVEKLLWELNFFFEHYFTTYKLRPTDEATAREVSVGFQELSEELESRATVLCHRDFHAANLMISTDGGLRIIDHQDARIGSVTYDLVSLLLDRVTEPPAEEWVLEKQRLLLAEREKMGMPEISEDEFAAEFRLQAIQRCLKAVGTFSYQSTVRGKDYFIPYIVPMLRIALENVSGSGRFPALRRLLESELA